MPYEVNHNTEQSLKDKHNEALLLLPTLFSEIGYNVIVCDPPYAGDYGWTPNLSLYANLENTEAYITDTQYIMEMDNLIELESIRERAFVLYSLFRTFPQILQPLVYDNGKYHSINNYTIERTYFNNILTEDSISTQAGYNNIFLYGYNALLSMEDMTYVDENSSGSLILFVNNTTHEPTLLKEPEYEPSEFIDNTIYDMTHTDRFSLRDDSITVDTVTQMRHYHINSAALLKFGNYLQYLKQEGIYDNTRIIIVSDHGALLGSKPEWELNDNGKTLDIMQFNPILLVKDFNSSGELNTDYTFMTNADTPSLAMKDIIDNPINPFTGVTLDESLKQNTLSNGNHVLFDGVADVAVENGTHYKSTEYWEVFDNILDPKTWRYIGKDD